MNNGHPMPAVPTVQSPPQLTVKAIDGGLVVGITYDYLQVQLIVPEGTIPGLIAALKKHSEKIPRILAP